MGQNKPAKPATPAAQEHAHLFPCSAPCPAGRVRSAVAHGAPMTALAADPMTLRDRLLALRRSALARLAEGSRIDPGMLRLVADAGAALAAIDAEAVEALAPAPAGRAVLLDDNHQITLALFTADHRA